MGAKCPCCSAPLRFDGEIGKLKCDACGNEYEEELMRQVDDAMGQSSKEDEMAWETTGAETWSGDETQKLHTYSCPSCGAEIVVDETTAATECVYCGNPSIMPGQMSGDYRPDAVLPFKKTKKDAQNAYKKLIAGKRLLPPLFAQENRIEKITGVYVPFWLFECDAEADMTFRAERTSVHTHGNYRVTDTDHFLVLRGGKIGFSNVPVDGSTKFQDNLTEAIEPFDHENEESFSTAYLPGYQAERYDVDADAAKPRADERVRESVREAFAATVSGYTSVVNQSASIRLEKGNVRNVLIPVWMLNTRWKDKTYTFAMNGRTGKIVGKLPIDKKRAFFWGLGLLAGSFVVLFGGALALFATGVI
jgi:predicted RNA-binding Zn-ribbon protein involved in translation (DUF1610 family)